MVEEAAMNNSAHAEKPRYALRVALVATLGGTYVAAGAYLNVACKTDVVYTHFAYLPAVLACFWWGRRGLPVVAALAAAILLFHAFGIAAGTLWRDVERVAFLALVGTCVAILSERAAAGQRAARRSEELYALIVEKSLSGILIYQPSDFRITFASSRFGEMLGWPAKELVGREIWELFPPEDRDGIRQRVQEREAMGFSDLHYECRLLRRDGSIIWAEVLSSVAQQTGERAVLVNAYDITARKDAEAKRRELAETARNQEEQLVHSTRLAELGEMAAAVAHDLNQPLTGIRNFAKNAIFMLEQDGGRPEDVKDNLRLITEQVDRAARIIHQMRGMTRKTERQLALVDLNAIIRESVEFLMPQLRLTGVETRLELAPELPKILGDRTRLEQVFLNLLTNARQAMEEREARHLTVRTALADGGNRPVVIEVSDTGKGFSADEASRLFTPFYSTKKDGHGTGLGLTISQRIVKDHGGVVAAEGVPGQGACFTIRLPLPKPEEIREALGTHG